MVGTVGPEHNGYSGCQTRGLALVSSHKTKVINQSIDGVTSDHCDAYGIDIMNDSEDNVLDYIKLIQNVQTLADGKDNLELVVEDLAHLKII